MNGLEQRVTKGVVYSIKSILEVNKFGSPYLERTEEYLNRQMTSSLLIFPNLFPMIAVDLCILRSIDTVNLPLLSGFV